VRKNNDPADAGVDAELVGRLVEQARAAGLQLSGDGGLLQQLTKRVLEAALNGEITDHLGYDKGDPAGKNGGNSRNGARAKTVLTEVGPVDIVVPRDRDGSFEPQIVRKRQRRLTGVEDMVISLSAKGLTTGEIQAHLVEVYGAEVSRQTISTITDKVLEQLQIRVGVRRADVLDGARSPVLGVHDLHRPRPRRGLHRPHVRHGPTR
jgi:transposase-like protein